MTTEIKCFFCGLEITNMYDIEGLEYASINGREYGNVHRDRETCIRLLKERLKKYES